jgi:hypothetical protein
VNSLSKKSFSKLFILPDDKQISELNFSGNILKGNSAGEILFSKLSISPPLTCLILRGCQLSDISADFLAKALTRNEVLEVLDVSCNLKYFFCFTFFFSKSNYRKRSK